MNFNNDSMSATDYAEKIYMPRMGMYVLIGLVLLFIIIWIILEYIWKRFSDKQPDEKYLKIVQTGTLISGLLLGIVGILYIKTETKITNSVLANAQ